jgi:hypothetical protein
MMYGEFSILLIPLLLLRGRYVNQDLIESSRGP